MKVRVKHWLADDVNKLLDDGKLVTEGFVSREIARALRPFRKRGRIMMGPDRELGKSVLVVNGIKKKARKKRVGYSIFDLELL